MKNIGQEPIPNLAECYKLLHNEILFYQSAVIFDRTFAFEEKQIRGVDC